MLLDAIDSRIWYVSSWLGDSDASILAIYFFLIARQKKNTLKTYQVYTFSLSHSWQWAELKFQFAGLERVFVGSSFFVMWILNYIKNHFTGHAMEIDNFQQPSICFQRIHNTMPRWVEVQLCELLDFVSVSIYLNCCKEFCGFSDRINAALRKGKHKIEPNRTMFKE